MSDSDDRDDAGEAAAATEEENVKESEVPRVGRESEEDGAHTQSAKSKDKTAAVKSESTGKQLPAALLAKLKKRGIVTAASATEPTPAPQEGPLPDGWRIVMEKSSGSR